MMQLTQWWCTVVILPLIYVVCYQFYIQEQLVNIETKNSKISK